MKARLTSYWGNLSEGVELTSDRDPAYNCVAWAAEGDTTRWWQDLGFDLGGYYWPPHLRGPESGTVVGWIHLFRSLGYSVCDSAELERGYEKIAIYIQKDATVEHVARQLETGAWTSKLGQWEDITHPTPDDLCGVLYGRVGPVIKRPRSGREHDARP